MLDKFLKEVIVITTGKQAEAIVDLLDKDKYVNEFLIAKKLDITINQTRNILYKLSDNGLVSSTRKKDKKKGWYTYFWKIEILKALLFLKKIFNDKREHILQEMNIRKSKQFYVCNICHVEHSEEEALLSNFTCDECGNLFELKDNVKVIKDFEREISKIDKDIEFIDEEIKKEEDKLEKQRLKELKKEEKEKEKEKQLRKKESQKKRDAAKKSEKKKSPKKKVVKKKPVKKVAKKLIKSIKKVVAKKSIKKPINKISKKPLKKSSKKPVKVLKKKVIKSKKPVKKSKKK